MFAKFKRWLTGRTNPLIIDFVPQMITLNRQTLTVRRAISHDIVRMVEIERTIFGTPPWSAAAFELELSRHRDRLYLVIVAHDERPIAYAGCSFNWYHHESHITNIAVDPVIQDQGLGTILITTLQHYSYQQGMQWMSLEVRASNLAARQLYERLGFRQSKIKHGYYLDDREDAVEMKVKLTNKGVDKESWQNEP